MPKVEPSGDDTLTEILEAWGRACMDILANPRISPDKLLKAKTEARTQLLQYIEGVIGEDIPVRPNADPNWNYTDNRVDAINKRLAEQRQRLRGDTLGPDLWAYLDQHAKPKDKEPKN